MVVSKNESLHRLAYYFFCASISWAAASWSCVANRYQAGYHQQLHVRDEGNVLEWRFLSNFLSSGCLGIYFVERKRVGISMIPEAPFFDLALYLESSTFTCRLLLFIQARRPAKHSPSHISIKYKPFSALNPKMPHLDQAQQRQATRSLEIDHNASEEEHRNEGYRKGPGYGED
jgi:hypothetical protein